MLNSATTKDLGATILNDQAPTIEAITKSNVKRADPKQQDTTSLGQNLGSSGSGPAGESPYKEHPLDLGQKGVDKYVSQDPSADGKHVDYPKQLPHTPTPALRQELQPGPQPAPGMAPKMKPPGC